MNLALTLFIAVIILLIGGIWLFHKIFPDFESDNLGFVFFVAWLFTITFTSIAIYGTYVDSIKYYEERHEYYIYSLGNDKYMEGDFGLFTGSINEIDYYFFYVNYVNGMGREKIATSNGYIKEGDYRPEVRGVYEKYRDEDRFWKVMDEYHEEHFRIYVPRNTIIRDFKVR